MELRALRYFVTVAEELHFGRAAERLHIAQPAVSQQVARLERELGARLLDRSPRTVRLTEAGLRVLDAAREVLVAADNVKTAAHGIASQVRIGTVPGLTNMIERGLDALRELNPEAEVVLVDLPVDARLAALRHGELDLALARGVLSASGLRAEPMWEEPMCAVVSVRHPLADRESVSLAELSKWRLRGPSLCDLPLRDAIQVALHEAGVNPEIGRATGNPQDTIVEIGTDPDSWALGPVGQFPAGASDRVRALPLDPPVRITGSVLCRADGSGPECVSTVMDAFRAAGNLSALS